MSGTKFFVHGGGMWREVDEDSGRVTGWGKIQFVYLSRGRLVVASNNSVLRGLRALLAGKPTTVRDGPRLQVFRPKRKEEKEQKGLQHESNHCNCCTCGHAFQHNHQLATDIIFNNLIKQTTNSTGTQCALTIEEPIKVIQNPHEEKSVKQIETEERQHRTKTLNSDKVPRKELIIDEEDVLLVRRFIQFDKRNIFDISLVDYDANDNCKRSVFYKINPLVVVEKSSKIAQLIRPPSQCSSVSLKEFIAQLGLQSINEVSKKSKYKMRQRKSQQSVVRDYRNDTDDTDKENTTSTKTSNSTSRRQEGNLITKIVQERKDNRIRTLNINDNKSYHPRPLKLTVTKNCKNKFSGVKNNSLLNMTRRLHSAKIVKINKNGATDVEDNSKKEKNNEKTLISRQDNSDKILLIRSKNKNVPADVSSDSECLADKKKQKSLNISRTLRSINCARPAMPTKVTSEIPKEMKKNKRMILNEATKQLSQSLPTKTTKNNISKLPLGPSSDEDTFQKDKQSDKSKTGLKQSVDTDGKQQRSKAKGSGDQKTSAKPNITCKGVLRAYSRAEDEAIVSWLKAGDRANLVNGNRVWKELKPVHYQTTGHHRPWQSLRNRYLRYILPALGSLAVPPALAQRLRAAAAQGEIKSKTNSNSANNSIFKSAPVRSAWALRPKSPVRSPPSSQITSKISPQTTSKTSPQITSKTPPQITSKTSPQIISKTLRSRASTSKSAQQLHESESDWSDTAGASRAQFSKSKRTLRSSAAHSPTLPTPKAKDRRDSLTYSELTRRFASRHRSTPQSDSSGARGEKRLHDTSDSGVSDGDAKIRRVTKNDSVSPSLLGGLTTRNSKRFRRRSKSPEQPRTRRLYNPRVV